MGPHGESPSLLLSHRCQGLPAAIAGSPHAVTFPCHAAWTCSRTLSVPLAGEYGGWRSTSDALDPASAIGLSPVLGANSGLFFFVLDLTDPMRGPTVE